VAVELLKQIASELWWEAEMPSLFFGKKSSNDMAFPHPKSGKDHYRKEDEPNSGGILWYFFKRTINITDYRNANNDVNPAKNRTYGGIFHDWSVNLFYGESQCQFFQTLKFGKD
jgi:hypothetical protein